MEFNIKDVSFSHILKRALILFKSNFRILFIVMFLFFFYITIGINYSSIRILELGITFELMDSEGEIYLVLYFLSILLQVFIAPLAYLSIYRILMDHITGNPIHLDESLDFAFTKYWSLFKTNVLSFLVVVIPGILVLSALYLLVFNVEISMIYIPIALILIIIQLLMLYFWMMYYAFLPCVVGFEDLGSMRAIHRTINLLRGNYWRMMKRFAFIMSIYLTIILLIVILTTFFALFPILDSLIRTLLELSLKPIVWIVVFLLYLDIRHREKTFPEEIIGSFVPAS